MHFLIFRMATNRPPITATLKLPYCWVCQLKLSDSGGHPSCVRNEHHIVPRAYGGEDGPTVSLCSADHDLLHVIAEAMIARTSYEDLLSGFGRDKTLRILYLSSVIKKADAAIGLDPNKRFIVNLELPPVCRVQMAKLKVSLGCRSYADLVTYLLEREHARRFPNSV